MNKTSIEWCELCPMACEYWKSVGLNWLILGACTGTKAEIMELRKTYPGLEPMPWHTNKWILAPKVEWIKEIVDAADAAGIPIFLKDNLKPIFGGVGKLWAFDRKMNLRQEFPK